VLYVSLDELFSEKERQRTNGHFLMASSFCLKNALPQDPLLREYRMGIGALADKCFHCQWFQNQPVRIKKLDLEVLIINDIIQCKV
jgi:hypothetical protein